MIHLPVNLYKGVAAGQRKLQECNANPEVKKGLLVVIEPMINMPQWMSMSCEQILQSLKPQEDAFLKQVQGKINERKRIEDQMKTPGLDTARRTVLARRLQMLSVTKNESDFYGRFMVRHELKNKLTGGEYLSCTTLKDVMANTCKWIAEAAIGGAAGKMFSALSKGVSTVSMGARAPVSAFQKAVSKIERSERVVFYDGIKRVENIEIKPGDTFTVIIKDNKIYLGKNIVGENGRVGGAKSHMSLMKLMGEEDPLKYYGRGGAVRFNENGSIDISGYHLEDDGHPRAYKDIQSILQEIEPDATFRATPDRLSTLPAPQ